MLPTTKFLKGRLKGNFVGSDICKWCNLEEESQEHILWDCELANWAWQFVANWWGIQIPKGHIKYNLARFKSPSIKAAWGVTWSSTLWTIWLCRFQFIF